MEGTLEEKQMWLKLIEIVGKEKAYDEAWSVTFWEREIAKRPELMACIDAIGARRIYQKDVLPRLGQLMKNEKRLSKFLEHGVDKTDHCRSTLSVAAGPSTSPSTSSVVGKQDSTYPVHDVLPRLGQLIKNAERQSKVPDHD